MARKEDAPPFAMNDGAREIRLVPRAQAELPLAWQQPVAAPAAVPVLGGPDGEAFP